MTSLCHFGEASVIVSLLASTLTTDDALPVMYVRRYHHEGGCWRTRYRDMGHTLVSKGAGDCVSRRGDQSGPRAAVAIGRLAPWPPWPRAASCAGLQVSIEPVDQARRDVDLIGASEEKMSLVGVNDELRPYAETPQSVPVFVGLRDRHLRIAIAAYDQSRCVHVLDERHRGTACVHRRVVVDRGAEVRDHPRIDVVRAVVTEPVRKSCACDRRLEAVCLGQGPHGHVAAVAPAGDPHPLRIDRRGLLRRVDTAQNVAQVAVAEVLDVGLRECLALTDILSGIDAARSEEHTSELQSLAYLVCRLLLEKKKTHYTCTSAPS